MNGDPEAGGMMEYFAEYGAQLAHAMYHSGYFRACSPGADRLMQVLEVWFQKIEDGSAERVMCDPLPDIPDEKVNALIKAIDEDIEAELKRNLDTHWQPRGIDVGPEFRRLPLPARRAMAAELRKLIHDTKPQDWETGWVPPEWAVPEDSHE